jgi:BirA family biotin operon repressor/biotin-[acetyl-CoA-carboxylase] ligase
LYKIPASTLFMGKNLVFVPECHSTNDLALQLCQQSSAADGTVIITDQQTRGRGQRGNSWEAEPGKNLTFSVILRPVFLPVRDQFFLNVVVSLAILDFLQNYAVKAMVKWPNDVMVGDRKICGILIENQVRGATFEHVVAGVGLNVNQQKFSMETPTSISLITGRENKLQSVFEGVLKNIEVRYLQLKEGKYSALKEAYIRAMFWFGEKRTFSTGEETFEGKITGIDEHGKLLVEHNETIRSFALKELTFLH